MKTTQRRSSISHKTQQPSLAPIPGLPARPALLTGVTYKATVSFVHDPAKFFVQLSDGRQPLAQLHDTLATFYRESNQPYSLAVGTLVMTPLQYGTNQKVDQTVHRAVVESLGDNQQMALVRLVDTGGSANVPTNLLKLLPGQMKQIVPFALQCGLHGMKSTGCYSDEDISKFREMFYDEAGGREVTLMGMVVEKGVQLVHILGNDGQNLTHIYRNAISNLPPPMLASAIASAIADNFPTLPPPVKERKPPANIATDYRRRSPEDLKGKTLPVTETFSFLFHFSFFDVLFLRVVIIAATSPSDFIINPKSTEAGDDLVEQLTMLNIQMTAFYHNLSPDELRVECAVPGLPVAALFPVDNCWYRAEVIGVRNEVLTVRFVDYGNVIEVSLTSEEGVRQLLPEFLNRLVAVAIQASLKDVLPPHGSHTWSSDAVDFMKQLIGANLMCTFLGRSPDSPNTSYVQLVDENGKEGEAVSVVDELKRRKLVARMAEDTLDNDHRPSSAPTVPTLSFPHAPQKMGVAELATVVDSSDPNKIWVQVASANNQLLMMAQRLGTLYADPAAAPPPIRFPLAKGQICVAQFVSDQQWYRAEVLDDVDVAAPIPVRFVDYGNCDVCHPSQVREVAHDAMLLQIPALSFAVRIAGIDPIINDVWLIAQDIFDNFVRDSSITLVDVDSQGVYQAQFIHKNGSNLSSLFISANLATAQGGGNGGGVANGAKEGGGVGRPAAGKNGNYQPLPSLDLPFDAGDFIDVFVTGRDEAEKIVYVQPVDMVPRVDALSAEMQQWPEDAVKRLDSVAPGVLCAAPFPADSLWYRAIVTKQTDDANVEVYFVDYGDTATVSKWSLRALPDEWALLPPHCFPVRVTNELPAVYDVVVIRIDDILQSYNPTRIAVRAYVFKERPPSAAADHAS